MLNPSIPPLPRRAAFPHAGQFPSLGRPKMGRKDVKSKSMGRTNPEAGVPPALVMQGVLDPRDRLLQLSHSGGVMFKLL